MQLRTNTEGKDRVSPGLGLGRTFSSVSRGCGYATILLGAVNLAIWFSENYRLIDLAEGQWHMTPLCSIASILAGLGLALASKWGSNVTREHLRSRGLACRLLTGVAGLMFALASFQPGFSNHVLQIIFSGLRLSAEEKLEHLVDLVPGSNLAALSLLITCVGLCFLDLRTRRGFWAAQVPFLAGIMISIWSLTQHALGYSVFSELRFLQPIPFLAAAVLALLSIGALASRPQLGIMSQIAADDVGGHLVRRLLPLALFGPVLLVWLFRACESIFGTAELSDVLLTCLYVGSLVLLLLGTARFMRTAERMKEAENTTRSAQVLLHQSEMAGEALRESQTLLEEAQELAGLGNWTLDLVTNAVYWSKESYRIFGFDPAFGPLDYTTCVGAIHSEDREAVLQAVRTSIETVAPFEYEFRVLWPDSSIRWVHVRVQLDTDTEGKAVRMHGLYQDITARKFADAQRVKLEGQVRQGQKMEAIGTLAGGIAHDFNNILYGIQGFSELVLDGLVPGSQAYTDQQEVLTATARAAELVKQILAFSRQSEARLVPVTVSTVVKEAARLIRASLPSTIEISCNIECADATVMGDPAQLHQIVMNLCTNAAHAMQEHGGKLAVSLRDFEEQPSESNGSGQLAPGPYVLLSVEDTGGGIAPNILSKIFDPFFTTKDVGQGTGLGLSTVHGIVSAMGGQVTAYSEMGSGTNFNVLLPRVADLTNIDSAPESPIIGGHQRILFVDDEALLARMGGEMLSRLGYRVMTQTDSTAALAAFKADPDSFDLVITDETMPKLTGTMLAQEILALRPDMAVILCTGFSQRVTPELAAQIGIRRYLLKPIGLRELTEAIHEALDRTVNGELIVNGRAA